MFKEYFYDKYYSYELKALFTFLITSSSMEGIKQPLILPVFVFRCMQNW